MPPVRRPPCEKLVSNFQRAVLVDAGGWTDTFASAGCSRSVVPSTGTHCVSSTAGRLSGGAFGPLSVIPRQSPVMLSLTVLGREKAIT